MFQSPIDPHVAQEQAARLRAAADAIDEMARRLDLRIESLHFEGPAARHFRAAMADRHARAQRVVRRIHEAADRLGASAIH